MRKLFTLVIAVLILSGCDRQVTVTQTENSSIIVQNSNGSASIDVITLPDGTKCAVLIGFYKGGISCDWQSH